MKADVSGRNRTLNGRTPSNRYFPPALCVSHPPPRTHSPRPLMIPHPRRYFHLRALIHIHFRCTSLPTSFRNLGSETTTTNRWLPPLLPLFLSFAIDSHHLRFRQGETFSDAPTRKNARARARDRSHYEATRSESLRETRPQRVFTREIAAFQKRPWRFIKSHQNPTEETARPAVSIMDVLQELTRSARVRATSAMRCTS